MTENALRHALKQLASTADGGVVFVGDVRDLSLQREFHASVALHRAAGMTTLDEVGERAAERIEREPELLVDPALFARLVDRMDTIHAFSRLVVATEIAAQRVCDIKTAYASVAAVAMT